MTQATNQPVTMLVTYRPKPGHEEALRALVEKHWPTLDAVGLAGPMKPTLWQATDIRSGSVMFYELFQWKDGNASDIAHQTPEVMAVWEPMGPIMESMTLARVEEI